jgi:hypothetical protein
MKKEIQDAKIKLIQKLGECETEEELIQVMQLKEEFMQKYCYETRNENRINFNDILMGSASGEQSPQSFNTDHKHQNEEQEILN